MDIMFVPDNVEFELSPEDSPRDWGQLIRLVTKEEVGLYREIQSWRDTDWICITFSEIAQEYHLWQGTERIFPGRSLPRRRSFFDPFPPPLPNIEAEAEYKWTPSLIREWFSSVRQIGKHSRDQVIELAKSKDLQKLVPMSLLSIRNDGGQTLRNIHGDFNGWVKLREKLDVTPRDILLTTNLELRRNLMDILGAEKFMLMVKHTILDVRQMNDGKEQWEDYLVQFGVRDSGSQLTMLFVKDSSTPRRYLIRVPPTLRDARTRDGRAIAPRWTVDAAVAWTFGMTLEEYKPVKET